MVKIIDGFIFYNEINLLNMRLHELDDYVDLFVIVESTETFSGNSKPLFYQKYKHLFRKFHHKIVTFTVNDMSALNSNNPWDKEKHQRNCIRDAINKIDLINDDDIILISDVDEIPNPNCFEEIKRRLINENIEKLVLVQRFFYYNFSCENREKFKEQKSRNTIAILNKNLKKVSPQYMRGRRGLLPRVNNGGWHCSYFGSSKEIINKIKQFSHQEYNSPKYLNEEKIEGIINSRGDLFNRSNEPWEFNDLEIDKNLPKFKNLVIDDIIISRLPF
jgi:beta-1,4-mannosyl-glycoprotein beta-1,4-N-acetylglucosaminyltransferase